MSLKSLRIPPVKDLPELTQFLKDFHADIRKDYVRSVEFGTRDKDAGKNLIIFDDAQPEPHLPTPREFPGSLTEEELAGKTAALQDSAKLVMRSYGHVLLGTEKKWVVLFDFDPAHVSPKAPGGPKAFVKTKAKVHNRGVPPDSFLDELVEWGKTAPSEIFEERATRETDVYASVKKELGPYRNLLHRKACMLEVMRVLAGFESSWKWNTGRDTTNPDENSPDTISSGPFQVSANSLTFGQDLRDLVAGDGIRHQVRDGEEFQALMKANHAVAFGYIARLLRHTIRHNGPVKRSEINEWLSSDAVGEFQDLLTP